MPNLVLEIGTEEMPAGAIESALEQLRAAVEKGLTEARLGAGAIEVYGTPRRLILRATDVPANQPDQEREVRGPSCSVAFDASGKPTGAAMGFAKKQGIAVEALERVGTPQGEYVQARVVDKGRPAVEVLGEILADAVRGLFFPKMMRWGEGAIRFVRPLRWILALLGSDVVPMGIAGVQSGRKSRGHRFLAPDEFEVSSGEELLEGLSRRHVMWNPAQRRDTIRKQADALAAEAGGSIPWDEGLLDENNWLVEWPTPLLGGFADEYLSLPRPVLVTAMKKHQRFFPVQDAAGNLLARFIAVRNGGDAHLDVVREGNERVLTSRFSDARYFHSQDQQEKLDDMAARLGRLVFQEKLGTLAEKRRRLMKLAGALADATGLSPADRALAVRAADVCKADLTSRMVIELPSLQGIMGREYALAAGEDRQVADAIAEHYMPRSASDDLPATKLGSLLALADRLDTLVGYVGVGILPSGSSDPYGLRRAAQGLVQLLARDPGWPPLGVLIETAAAAYREENGLDFDAAKLAGDLGSLVDQRAAAVLEERGVRYDLVNATLGGGFVLRDRVFATIKRGETLQAVAEDAAFVPTAQAAARVANILKSVKDIEPAPASGTVAEALASLSNRVQGALLKEPSEQRLFAAAGGLAARAGDEAAAFQFAELFRTLDALREPVNGFFDEVLVMAEDEAVRKNRLALLAYVDAFYKTLADFTLVVI